MKTTITQFNLFKKECQKLQGILGLYDWDMQYFHVPLEEDQAQVKAFPEQGNVAMIFADNHEIDTKDIKAVAAHEMSHVLTARLRDMACRAFKTEDEIVTEDERLANIIGMILLKIIGGDKQ